jgi:His-Xaa-Ser system protein HxsD
MNRPVLGSLLEYKLYYIMNSDNDKIIVVVDLNLYKKEVITAALYKFTHLFYVHQETDSHKSNLVQIIFESKDDIRFDKDISKEFGNELIDQQLRYNTNIQFGHIRDLIVEEAFKPVNVKR